MDDERFEWDDENVEHIARHDIEPEEVEDALDDRRRIQLGVYNVRGERRRGYLGRTVSGRLLTVVVTVRAGRLRVVTARDADAGERAQYRRRWRSS